MAVGVPMYVACQCMRQRACSKKRHLHAYSPVSFKELKCYEKPNLYAKDDVIVQVFPVCGKKKDPYRLRTNRLFL